MDCKLEESAQRTDPQALQGQEGFPEDGGEDGLSEGFRLLQMEVEYEHQEEEASPAHSEVWSSKNVQRKQRHWERIISSKKSKRKQEKERRKAKHAEHPGTSPQHSKRFLKALTKERLLEAKHSGPRLCVDLSMTHHMSKKELSRLAGQIRRLYGSNRKASRPFWICLTGFSTDSPLYEECLRMNDGFSAYLLDVTEEDCVSLFPLDTLVYLTPDSEHPLEDIDLNTVYIIGGLVDESIQKVTFQKAREYSIKTARLPIQEYMVRRQNEKNYHSEILAINQGYIRPLICIPMVLHSCCSVVHSQASFSVSCLLPMFDILSTYFETRNWPEALKKGVSPGKGYILRNSME
ncbi:tRNA methyltransferase 10 homolog B isoform X2 [Psammomys obesus]|uniref:tRNA methyltransferase 10 homolog B isoform X2 n=1 Tax=Psammomys obesus TaxID=48139 RepID=UPI0024531E20|nr:tRNA methyltransferase 10 homolog B isoform X2 [Psammomys obesus]